MVSSILGLGSSSYAGKTSMDGVLLDLIRTSFLRSGRLKFYDCVWKSCKPQHSKTHCLRCQLGLRYQRRGYLSTVITYRLSSRSEARLRPFSSGRTRIHERGLNWWCEWPGTGCNRRPRKAGRDLYPEQAVFIAMSLWIGLRFLM